jgi:progressive ankylosis protein
VTRPSTTAHAPARLPTRAIVALWLPLAATWLMMSVEGPYVAAITARLPDAALNLAAYGVAFSLAWLVESPIMMLLTAANTMVHDRPSFLAMRRFACTLNTALTAVMIIGVLPPVFGFLTGTLMGLPPQVVPLVHVATIVLIPWPAAIGYRRFHQGILIRHHLAHRVAYGTVVRLASMSVSAAGLALLTSLRGATIACSALAVGVVMEAAASRWMARHVVATLLAGPDDAGTVRPRQADLFRFYYPLALTSIISLVTGPLLAFFMGRSRAPIESLAVLPVVQALVFLFRSGGVAYQEAGVALAGRHLEHEHEVHAVGLRLGWVASTALGVLLCSPLAQAWLVGISGLTPALAEFALLPAQLLVLFPVLEYWLSVQRTRFILGGQTRVITFATAVEVAGVAAVLMVGISGVGMVGAVAGSVAQLAGRLATNLFLLGAARWWVGRSGATGAAT